MVKITEISKTQVIMSMTKEEVKEIANALTCMSLLAGEKNDLSPKMQAYKKMIVEIARGLKQHENR